MKKLISQIIFIFLSSVTVFIILEICNIKAYSYISTEVFNLFFTAITVLFSIGMSIIISIDFSHVINKEKREYFLIGLKSTVLSFCLYFTIDCFSILLMTIIKQVNLPLSFFHYIYIFSTIAILYSVFFFLHNFLTIFNFKMELEKKIFNENNK